MTIETRICEPIDQSKFKEISDLADKYWRIQYIIQQCHVCPAFVKLEILGDRILLNDKIVNVVVAMLEKELGETEKRLNALGYTMQDEPKEFKYHVNALKGRDDE